jgi:hypothetical protein
VIIVVAHFYRSSKGDNPVYKHYLTNIYYKLAASIVFAVFYAFYVKGGDTVAYYEGAMVLNNVFLESPSEYFYQMFTTPEWSNYTVYFNSRTGYPPSWIFKEPEGYFVCKIISIFYFVTFKSYFAATVILSFITAIVSWQLYRLTVEMDLFSKKYLAFAVLFIPSLNFWCTGVSKDTIVLISLLGVIYHSFRLILPEYKNSWKNWVMIVIYLFLIWHIRFFLLIPLAVPIVYSLSTRILRRVGFGNFGVWITRTSLLLTVIAVAASSSVNQTEKEVLEGNDLIAQAQIIQQDFQHNETYGEKRYDLGVVEFTSTGLIKVMPKAIIYGVFAPFIWNSFTPTLILNGLESMLFIYLIFLFFRRAPLRKLAFIRNNEFLTFALLLVFILSFLTGLTAGLYGVLVRVRAPLLPFLTLLLIVDWSKVDLQKKASIRLRKHQRDVRLGIRMNPENDVIPVKHDK